jgi:hypothetical protein
MIVGWHRRPRVSGARRELARVPVALFFTALRVTSRAGAGSGFPVCWTPPAGRAGPPGPAVLQERQTTVASYLHPVRAAIALARPVSAAFFAGKLDYGKLPFLHLLFVMLIIGARPGDSRDWELIASWARGLRKEMA